MDHHRWDVDYVGGVLCSGNIRIAVSSPTLSVPTARVEGFMTLHNNFESLFSDFTNNANATNHRSHSEFRLQLGTATTNSQVNALYTQRLPRTSPPRHKSLTEAWRAAKEITIKRNPSVDWLASQIATARQV